MIKHGNVNFQAQESKAGMQPIPVGVYVGQIIGAKVENGEQGQNLILQLEVTEGEYAGYFKRQFEAQAGGQYQKRYKGTLRLRVPNYNSNGQPATDRDRYAHQDFQHMAWALEHSNSGYTFDWDETKLKGKACAFSVRERDWFMEAAEEERGYRTGTTTEIARLESLEAFREGKVKVPKKRGFSQRDQARMAELDAAFSGGASTAETPQLVTDETLPF